MHEKGDKACILGDMDTVCCWNLLGDWNPPLHDKSHDKNNTIEQYSIQCQKWFRMALVLRYFALVIGPENSRHPLHR